MKKIIFCVTNDLSYDQRMHRICSTLKEEGYQVMLVGRIKKKSVKLPPHSYRMKRIKCYFNKGILFFMEYNLRLFFFLMLTEYDIAGAIDLDTIIPVKLSSFMKRKQCSFDAHEYFEEVPEVTGRPFVKYIWTKIANVYIPKMNKCYTVSAGLATLFTEKYKKQFVLIRNMPFLKDISKVSLPLIAQPYILYQGALNEGRGVEQLIRAMIQLPQYRLLIAGEGDLSIELRKLTKELEIEDKVLFLGYVQPDMLDNYTAGAYIGLNLLENKGLSYYYSLANKCFDYVQYGVPVLNMDFPEYRALNEEYEIGILLKSLDIDEIVYNLKLLFDDVNMHQRLRMNCLQAKLEWNWEKEKEKLIRLYSD